MARCALVCLLLAVGVTAAAPSTASLAARCDAITYRLDCGYVNITAADCHARGCCFSETGAPSDPTCFLPGQGVPLTDLHVIQSNHFDAGYADLTAAVLNKYFDEYFHRAVVVGKALDELGGAPRLKWMTQSWIVSLFLDCPANLGLHCPNDTQIEEFNEGVQKGYITWHAFPHNAQLSFGDVDSIQAAIDLTHSLDKAFSQAPKTTLSQRDVPGLPRAVIPALTAKGVDAISVGSNSRCLPPNVPTAFVWKDESASRAWSPSASEMPEVKAPSEEEILVLWHQYGYGEILEPSPARDFVQIPHSTHGVIWAWRGDNLGPPMSADEVVSDWENIRVTMQNLNPQTNVTALNIRASTLDAFMATVKSNKEAMAALPVISADLEDTWVEGIASDPVKSMETRAMYRARHEYVTSQHHHTVEDDASLSNCTRFIVKNMEHTWGISVVYYKDHENTEWDNLAFRTAVANGDPIFKKFASSWVEQRAIGVDAALEAAKPLKPLSDILQRVLGELEPHVPDEASLKGWDLITSDFPTDELALGGWARVVVGASGGLQGLQDTESGVVWADASEATTVIGELLYRTMVDDDFLSFRAAYLRNGTGGTNEYGKPNVTTAVSASQSVKATAISAWRRTTSDSDSVLVETRFGSDGSLSDNFGAPQAAWVQFDFAQHGKGPRAVNITVTLNNKTTTRLPESLHIRFVPVGAGDGEWAMDKLGEWTSPKEVADGASKPIHAIHSGVAFTPNPNNKPYAFFSSPDVPLANFGTPSTVPLPLRGAVDLAQGLSYLLHANNYWNTNYVFWWPFQGNESPDGLQTNAQFRFAMHSGEDAERGDARRAVVNALVPSA